MQRHWKNLGRIATLVVCSWWVGMSRPASAQDEGSVMLPPPADEEVVVKSGPAVEMVESGPMAVCQPCIDYRTRLSARRMFRCGQATQVIMVTKNPADCCQYEIPLCLPCCCEGEPTMCSDCGLLGRGVVEYTWECGFKATVIFRPILCDVKVVYEGC